MTSERTLFLALTACLLFVLAPIHLSVAAEDPIEIVRSLRAGSNKAIRERDAAKLRTFFDDDYLGIQGTSGGLDKGGEATARSYADEEFKDPSFIAYERTPQSLQMSESRKRIAEQGNWVGLWTRPDGQMRQQGVYLATWTVSHGQWRLHSETFVTLSCSGSAACASAD